MKKIILSVAAICMMAVTAVSAQEFTYGVKVGVNIANISCSYSDYDYDDEGKSRMSLALGVMGEYKLSDQMAVSAELLYSGQGNKYKDSYSESYDDWSYSSESTTKNNLSYLNIPILFNYYVMDGLAVKAGIQPGFLLGAKGKWDDEDSDSDGYSYSDSGSEDIKKDYNSMDFAIPIGVSYDITENLMVDMRYNIGVANISKYTDGGYSEKNNVFQISVGYKF